MKLAAGIVVLAVTWGVLAVEPHVKYTEEPLKDGYVSYSRVIFLNHGKLTVRQISADGKTAVSKKWGDHIFGFDFGRMPRTNGGWSIWGFLRCMERIPLPNGKVRQVNLLKDHLPEEVVAGSINGTAVVDLIYPSASGGKLKIRLMQFPSHPEWTFIRFTSEGFSLSSADFAAYPHNANFHKDMERHLADGKQDWNLTRAGVSFKPETPYLAMYNKFRQDNAGNFLIFHPEDFSRIAVPKSVTQIMAQMFPAKGKTQFAVALGYFADRPADDAVNRFLGEDGDAVRKFMDSIDWDPAPSVDEFERQCAEAVRLDVPADKLEPLRKQYQDAVRNKDNIKAAKCLAELQNLMKSAVSAGLDRFR
jgi:hypothetical protein